MGQGQGALERGHEARLNGYHVFHMYLFHWHTPYVQVLHWLVAL